MHAKGRRFCVALVAASSFFVLSACAGDATVGSSNDTTAPTRVDTTGVPGDAQWSAPLIGGGTFSLAKVPLERPVALWFWAPG